MESNRFDMLTHQLTVGDTRRGAVRSLAVAGFGLGLARLGLGEAAARKKKGKKKLNQTCKKGKECKGNLGCQLTQADEDHCGTNSVAKRCCIPLGGRCDYGCECCGTSVICNGHVCQSA